MQNIFTRKIFILLLIISFITCQSSIAQITTPRVSPAAEVSQVIGVSKITINYSRPAVNNRTVWGELVPYGLNVIPFGNGEKAPWRAGANENTTITFSDDVKINGSDLTAGTYGVHLIVNKDEDWVFIFSNDSKAWGSFFYDPNHDALRVKVKPESTADFTEWLEYGFDKITGNSARAYLKWEQVKVGFNCEFNSVDLAFKSIEEQLTGAPGFSWQAWQQAAFYCLQSNTKLDTGEKWVRKSISINENSQNRNLLGYILMGQGKTEEAENVFKENIDKYPNDWNLYDSYGEFLNNSGRKKESIEYYKKALDKAPQNQKKRIEDILSGIKI